jgi:hypothetical protein
LEVRGWRLEVGGWRLKVEGCVLRHAFSVRRYVFRGLWSIVHLMRFALSVLSSKFEKPSFEKIRYYRVLSTSYFVLKSYLWQSW